MRTPFPEKILKIIADLDTHGNVALTRLTVLKEWFEHPGRLAAFGLWVVRRSAGRSGKTKAGFKGHSVRYARPARSGIHEGKLFRAH